MTGVSAELGHWGESVAEEHYRSRGYHIVFRNFRCKVGELDLVAARDDELVIIEVKTRSSDLFQDPEESVTFSKQKKICRATRWFYQYHWKIEATIRFDVVSIIGNSENYVLNCIEDAFVCE